MKKKLAFIISGVLLCAIASLLLNQIALGIIEQQENASLAYLFLPILILAFGIRVVTKGIRIQISD